MVTGACLSVLQWEQFMKLGEDIEDSVIEEKVDAQRPEQCALLLYTVSKPFSLSLSPSLSLAPPPPQQYTVVFLFLIRFIFPPSFPLVGDNWRP